MTKRFRVHQSTVGFTLVEMLIAVAIAILILALVFTILNGASAAQTSTRTRIQASEGARVFFEVLERDLAGAFPGPWLPAFQKSDLAPPGSAIPDAAVGIHGEVIKMTTTSDTRLPGNEYFSVRYYVARKEIGEEKRLYREVDPAQSPTTTFPFITDPDAATVSTENVLCMGVRRLRVQYAKWNSAEGRIEPVSETDPLSSHLDVVIEFGVDTQDERFTKAQKGGLVWSFHKLIPIPATLP
ncbi:MAG: hypothetical protein AMXMBFR7_01750 [Planctomycetota bacterium]